MYRVPIGSLVVATNDADLEYLLETHRELVVTDPRQLDPRLRTRTSAIVPSTSPSTLLSVIEHAKALAAPVVIVGDSDLATELGADVIVPSGSPLAFLTEEDVSGAGPTVVVGDVHNCHRTVRTLLDAIGVKDAQDGQAPFVVFVGDLVDKGGAGASDALETLDLVMDLVRKGQALALRGNHDHMLHRRLTGKSPLTTYSKEMVSAVKDSAEAVAYQRFLARLPLAVKLDNTTYAAHANYSPQLHGRTHPKARHHLEQVCCFGAPARDALVGTLVHGHEQVKAPKVTASFPTLKVNVDTSCCDGNALTAYKVGSDPYSPEAFISVPCDPDDVPSARH